MDPLTQATVGAAAAALVCQRAETRHALLLGALAGAAPDLDVLIRSNTDPLLALQYHRHFTHALVMAPVIGLIVAALFKAIFFCKPWPYRRLALFAVMGALTHGLIDACTSYGTLLYWPINHHRESWDIISIIDPIFTLPLLLLTIFSFALRRPRFAQLGLVFCLVYLSLGIYQRSQAAELARGIASERGHVPQALTVRPSLGNIVLWRIIYRVGDDYYVDAVRTTPFSAPRHYPGKTVAAFSIASAQNELLAGSVQAGDVARFRFFSQGYLGRHIEDSAIIGDLRYAMYPDSVQPLWGIRLNSAQVEQHVLFEHFRDPSQRAFKRLWKMIQGRPVTPLESPEK